jgi:hypothetical protein
VTYGAMEIMTDCGQSLPFARDLREALGLYARRTWPLNTSGHAAKAWGIDKATAANLLKGHASDTTITRILRANGWSMAIPVLGAVIGQSLEDHVTNEIRKVADEREAFAAQEAQLVRLETHLRGGSAAVRRVGR